MSSLPYTKLINNVLKFLQYDKKLFIEMLNVIKWLDQSFFHRTLILRQLNG